MTVTILRFENKFLTPNFHIYYPVCVEFGTENPHVMLFTLYKFGKNQFSERPYLGQRVFEHFPIVIHTRTHTHTHTHIYKLIWIKLNILLSIFFYRSLIE
jgi:hypothetical protein